MFPKSRGKQGLPRLFSCGNKILIFSNVGPFGIDPDPVMAFIDAKGISLTRIYKVSVNEGRE